MRPFHKNQSHISASNVGLASVLSRFCCQGSAYLLPDKWPFRLTIRRRLDMILIFCVNSRRRNNWVCRLAHRHGPLQVTFRTFAMIKISQHRLPLTFNVLHSSPVTAVGSFEVQSTFPPLTSYFCMACPSYRSHVGYIPPTPSKCFSQSAVSPYSSTPYLTTYCNISN